jgi:hypothetical protein
MPKVVTIRYETSQWRRIPMVAQKRLLIQKVVTFEFQKWSQSDKTQVTIIQKQWKICSFPQR